MAASVFTYGLIGVDANQTIVASIIAANTAATTMVIDCPKGTDPNDCGLYGLSVTVGPWAMATPPPGASTGAFDVYGTFPLDTTGTNTGVGTASVHCDIVSTTVVAACTSKGDGGGDASMVTVTSPDPSDFGPTPFAITVTAGLDKLTSLTTGATAAPTSSSSGPSQTGSSSTASKTGTATGTATGSSTGSAASHSSGASAATRTNAGALGLFGLVFAFLLR